MTVPYACDCVRLCVGISGRNTFKGGKCATPEKKEEKTVILSE